ncbi:endothelial cell-specific molecule 1-like [Acipenser ruthenus]|uniref:endothelial cell-specific molecule 1-like n=1 Tax=Acipenser ruthenus TaxID=7906 RepID=UPI00155FD991|nr:endothelial cell-specific molecule 1-like [Acipenser ruthenus]
MQLSGFMVFLVLLLMWEVDAWSVNVKYPVDCPERCDVKVCTATHRCKRTVLDDCGCCRVCAAARGELCYRTVSGMDGVKCGPGLRCHFYNEEDDFGDEYGICKECPYGTHGLECRKTCNCKTGICDRETGKCLKFPFFPVPASKPANRLKFRAQTDNEMGSGDHNSDLKEDLLKEKNVRSSAMKWLNPR